MRNRQDIIFGSLPTLQSDKTFSSPAILSWNTTLHLAQDKSLGFRGLPHCQLDGGHFIKYTRFVGRPLFLLKLYAVSDM